MQRHVLYDFLVSHELFSTEKGNTMLVEGLLCVLRSLKTAQSLHSQLFLSTLEDSCTAANDFFRMSERMEEVLSTLLEIYPFLRTEVEGSEAASIQEGAELVSLFTRDSVYAAERTHAFTMKVVHQSLLSTDMFSPRWEDEWTNNEVAVALARKFDSDLKDIQYFLCDDFLYYNAAVVAAKAMIYFYVQCLIEKAHQVRYQRQIRNRIVKPAGEQEPFHDHERALLRMKGDLAVLSNFILDKVSESSLPWFIISKELAILDLIHACLSAKELESLESFAVEIHRRIGADVTVTRHFVGDLWLLTNHLKRRLYRTIALLDRGETADTTKKTNECLVASKTDVPLSFTSLTDMLRSTYKRYTNFAARVVLMYKSVQLEGIKLIAMPIQAFRRNVPDLRR